MTTPSLGSLIDRFDHLLDATRGIARALDPDPLFSEEDRGNLYALCLLVIEQQEHCIKELLHLNAAQRTAVPPAQEGDAHGQ
jgi:hypothetical protein